jgi:predicted esterase
MKFLFLILFFTFSCSSFNTQKIIPVQIENIGKLGYQKINLPQNLIYYFLTSSKPTDPLIIAIQGSGCDSLFSKDKDGIVYSSLPAIIGLPFKVKASILAVEKPGVLTFDREKDKDCSTLFRKKFTFDHWIETLKMAISDVQLRYKLQPSRTIIIGHSEGADSAALLASHLDQATHVLHLSGGSGSPVFQAAMRAIWSTDKNQKKEEELLRSEMKVWTDAVSKNDPDILLWGHTYRYWKSLPHIADKLNVSKAKILIVYGTKDSNSPVVTSDLLLTELVERNREFKFRRIPNADHKYTVEGKDHISEIITDSINWALSN